MSCLAKRTLSLVVLAILVSSNCIAFRALSAQETKPKDDRGLGVRPNASTPTPNQQKAAGPKPEIVLQAGITSPQSQIGFSRDGRLLASMGMTGNSIKLWEISSGRLLRQLESSIPTIGVSSISRPFRFSADGRTLIAMADGRIRRWEIETGRELNGTVLSAAKDLMTAVLNDDGSVFAGYGMKRNAVRAWDTTTGREFPPITFDEDEDMATNDSFALSGDGRSLAVLTQTVKTSANRKSVSMATARQLTIWEVSSGKKTQTFKVSTGPIQYGVTGGDEKLGLAFAANSPWVALRDETSMRIWDLTTGRELKTFGTPRISGGGSDTTFPMFASKFLFSPDRRVISIVSETSKITLFDASSNTALHTLSGHSGAIVGLSFSTDGKLIASSSIDNRIKLWDTATGREVRTLSGAALPVSDLAFSADGKSLSIAGHQAVSTWELTTAGVKQGVVLPDDYGRPRQYGINERSGFLSRDGRLVIAGSSTQPIAKVWETASGREVASISLSAGKELGNVAFKGDGSAVALIEKNHQISRASDPHSAQQSPAQNPANMPTPAIAMPDMTKIMEQMKKDPKKMQEQMKKAQEAMSKGDWSAGMSALESMGVTPPITRTNKTPNSLRIFDSATGRQLQEVPVTGGFMNELIADTAISGSSLSFSPDGRVLASSVGFAAPISLRDLGTGQELRALKATNSFGVYGLGWSADSQKLASAHWGTKSNVFDPNAGDSFSYEDMTFSIKVWDVKTGGELQTLTGHNNIVSRLAFSRDGRFLASGGSDSTIKLWDLAAGREVCTLKGHSGSIAALDFSPDGRFVVSGSEDGSTKLWSAQSGDLLATMVTLNKGDDWLVVTPDGLFDGSPAGWDQILWRFSSNTFDVSPVEIFFSEYFHPGLLSDILAGKKIAAVADISQKDRRQPKLRLETPDQQNVTSRALTIRVNVIEAPAGAQDVRLFRNGSLVKVWRGDVLKGKPSAVLETTISVVAGQNRLSAYGFNRDNVKSPDATLAINGADSLKRPATLHLLAVGVNQYANGGYNLKYAGADARVFVEEMERQQKKLNSFAQIEITTLFDKDATRANILHALKRLAGSTDAKAPSGAPVELEKIKPAEPEDAVIVFYAGHGTAQDQRFYLIPHDLGYAGARTELDEVGLKTILSHSVSDLDIEQAFEGIDAGHLLMVIDACNSGQALEAEEKRRGPMNSKGLAQLAYEKGMYILTAAQSYQAAMEAEQLGHGYLTFALVEEGLKSTAADGQPKDGQVVLREWLDYATERVPRMQEAKIKEGRGLKHTVAFVEGDEKVDDLDKRSVQRPRVFYRREPESQPMVVAKP
jgi:WD40 repeat protein